MQQSLQKASFALLSTCDKRFLQLAMKSQVETKEMLAHSVDAIALAGHMASKLSTLEREHLKPSLRPDMRQQRHYNLESLIQPGRTNS